MPRVLSTAVPALRADAARNRRAVLESARALFAQRGLDTGVEEVAEGAGVGVGTIYRHFPSKSALVDAVFEEILQDVSALADEALGQVDPWVGFAWFVKQLAALGAGNQGLRHVMRSRLRESPELGATWSAGADRIEQLVRRAQRHGSLRLDVGLADVRAMLWGAMEVADIAGDAAPGLWQRHLHLLLDGLRAGSATPMPSPPIGRARAREL